MHREKELSEKLTDQADRLNKLADQLEGSPSAELQTEYNSLHAEYRKTWRAYEAVAEEAGCVDD